MNMNLMQPVAALARSRRFYSTGILLASTAAAALAALALLAVIDVLMPFPRLLRVAIAGAGGIALLAFLFHRIRATRRRNTRESAACAMEAAQPEIGQRIRTALEIAQRGIPKNAGAEERWFAERLLAQSDDAVSKFSWRALIPRARWAAWMLAAAGVLGSLAFTASKFPDFRLGLSRFLSPATAGTYTRLGWVVAPRVFDDHHPPRFELRVDRRLAEPVLFIRERGGEWVKTGMTPLPDGRSWDIVLTGRTGDLDLYAAAGDARTEPHRIAFRPIPKLTAVATHLAFPEYTGLKAESRTQGDVSVVEDTRVRWEFTFNVPPARIEWRVGSDPAQPLAVDGRTARAEWTAGTSRGAAIVSVLGESGEAIDSWRFTAEGFADALPTVELLEPAKDQDATSISELPVRIRAKDDFGVSEIGLVLEAAGQREWVLEKVVEVHGQRDVSEIASAMLEKVPVTLRDNVRLYAYALDNKPRGGPRAVSPLRSIDIREFKKRWMFQDGDGAGGGDRKKLSDGLMKLGEIITSQRGIVSDTFLLRESTRSSAAAAFTAALPIGRRESELSEKSAALVEKWTDEGGIPHDDITLLDTAGTQMIEAAGSLGLAGQPAVEKGFDTADRALATLLQLRKRLITILTKANCDCDKPKSEDQMKPLTALAKEADRLAREEHDVRGQLAPEIAAGTNIEATRRQHEVAVSDGGELYAEIVDHPQANEEMMRLMDSAEKTMRAADETLRGSEPREAAPTHEGAAKRLVEVAEFLRAMELAQVAETLKKLGDKAEQNAQAACKPDAGEKKDVQQAARDTAMADKILGSLAEKAGKDATADKEIAAADKGLGQELAELREQTAPGKLADELGKLADSKNAAGKETVGKLNAMAREFRDAADRIAASRAARLAAALAQAKALEKKLADAGDKKPGDKSGAEPGDKPGNSAGQKPGDKPGGQGLAKGDKPGAKPGDKPGQQGLAKSDKPGEGKGGDKPEDAKKNGKGGIAGDIEEAQLGAGGQAMGRFAKALQSIGDDKLHEFSIKLFDAPFSRDSIPLVEDATQRLQELVLELPVGNSAIVAGHVPDARRREVEDYFRDLSNDFGDEQWTVPEKE